MVAVQGVRPTLLYKIVTNRSMRDPAQRKVHATMRLRCGKASKCIQMRTRAAAARMIWRCKKAS